MGSAVVVGSGPNGLACAVALAREGLDVTVIEAEDAIGGGTRSSELTVPGVLHDHCSAVHPMAVASPFMQSLDLERHGLRWLRAEIDLAHPLDGGEAAVLVRSLEETARGLGADGGAWRRLFERPARGFPGLVADDLLRPVLHPPRHPLRLARFGIPAALPATALARVWRGEHARALFGGVAAHAFSPLNRPMSSSVGMALTTACHAFGWAVPEGGSRAISDALAAELKSHGGRLETGRRVTSISEVEADVVALDLTPAGVLELAGERLPDRVQRAYRRYRHGPGAFKVDLAVEGGVPWTAEAARRAGTVHVAGTWEEIVHAEREVNRGRMPGRPFVLVAQQYLADPSRSAGDVHPVWAYAHVPSGWRGDGERAVMDAIERFAPGLRERIVATSTRSPAELEAGNANYRGGDIIAGANSPLQTVIRPRFALDPYATGIPGVFICSAATPPGAGVHGMCGANAARSALRYLAGR